MHMPGKILFREDRQHLIVDVSSLLASIMAVRKVDGQAWRKDEQSQFVRGFSDLQSHFLIRPTGSLV